MMSNQKKMKIMERLANDPILEMNDDDLEQLLEAELAKPADEIDSSLVEEILDALNAPAPTPEQSEASWQVIKEHFTRQAKARTTRTIKRFGAVAAVVIMIMFVSLRDAEAFRWTLIEKILKPVAETFGIVIDDQESIIPEENEPTLYSIEDAPSEYIEYNSLEDVPETAHGYPIRPNWIPEGFEFSSASQFIGPDSEIYSIDFFNQDAWFGFRAYIITSDSAIYSQEFERNLDIPIEMQIGNHIVTFYTNATDETQYAFWIHENAHYSLTGNLSVDDISAFVLCMD